MGAAGGLEVGQLFSSSHRVIARLSSQPPIFSRAPSRTLTRHGILLAKPPQFHLRSRQVGDSSENSPTTPIGYHPQLSLAITPAFPATPANPLVVGDGDAVYEALECHLQKGELTLATRLVWIIE